MVFEKIAQPQSVADDWPLKTNKHHLHQKGCVFVLSRQSSVISSQSLWSHLFFKGYQPTVGVRDFFASLTRREAFLTISAALKRRTTFRRRYRGMGVSSYIPF